MPNDDLHALSDAELRAEITRLASDTVGLREHLSDLSGIAEKKRGAKEGKRLELGIGFLTTLGGFATLAATTLSIGLAFVGAAQLFRSGFSYFKEAASDDQLALRIDEIGARISHNLARAEQAKSVLVERASP